MIKLTKISIAAIAFMTIFATAMAASVSYPPLDKVSFNLSAEQWASTTTAKVSVRINATLTDKQLGTIHSKILNNLQKIVSKAKWHIVQFNRNKNQSGLEQLYAVATARVPEADLANIRKKAKAVSQAGETYRIASINFAPSQSEIQATKAALRANIYAQTKAELASLNKEYTDETFFLHAIKFYGGVVNPRPQMHTMVLTQAKMGSAKAAMAVSDKVRLNANVVLASNYNIK